MKAKTVGWTTSWIGIALLVVAFTGFGTAWADDTICSSGDKLKGSYDNISVEPPGRCVLYGAEVQGNVYVRENARLVSIGSSIDGNLQAEGDSRVSLRKQTFVGGDVQADNAEYIRLNNIQVDGSVQLNAMNGPRRVSSVTQSDIGGDLQAFDNLTKRLVLKDNVIDGNLQCKENDRAPNGGNNFVGGNKEDQCGGL